MFTVVSSKKEWISKQKNNKLTCTENLMIKLWTAILLLVDVEPFVCSREHNLSEIFIVLLVLLLLDILIILECNAWILEDIYAFKDQKGINKTSSTRTPVETFQFKGARSTTRKWWSLRQTQYLIRVTNTLVWSVLKLLFACSGFSVRP